MRVLVTGASGMLGLHLVEALKKRGHEAVSLVRPNTFAKRPWARRILADTPVSEASVTDPHALARAVDEHAPYDAVIHTAAVLRGRRAEWSVNFEGTRNLLKALERHPPGALVLVSSILALGDRLRETAEELEECAPRTVYEKSKCEAEKLSRRWGSETGWRVAVVRPTWMYGKYSLNPDMPRLLRMAKRGVAPVLGGKGTPLALVSAGDVAEAILVLLEAGASGIYNVRGPRIYRSEEVADALLTAVGRRRGVKVPVPRLVLRPMVWYMGVARYLLLAPSEIPITRLEGVGYKPRTDLVEGLRRMAAWMEEEGLL